MGKDSKVSWTDHTWNPWWGCTKLTDRRECDRCYAEGFAKRVGRNCWGPKAERRIASEKVWNDPIRWDREAAKAGKRAAVFCMSMGDLFENRRDLDAPRARAFDVMRATPNLIWLLLTKRPHNAFSMLPNDLLDNNDRILIGATIGTQKAANEPTGPVDFLSCEPLLEHIDIHRWLEMSSLRTIIIGGESSGSRPGRDCPIEAARFVAVQANMAGKCVYIKQLHIDGKLVHDPSLFPADLRVRELAWRTP